MGALRKVWFWLRSILRWAGSSLCFQTYFYAALLLTLTVIPLMRLTIRDPLTLRRRLLALLSLGFRAFMQLMVTVRMLDRFKTQGKEWHDTPCLVIANHPTLIDIVALFACLPKAGCVVKGSLLRHFFFGGVIRAAGYIPNDSGPAMLQLARKHFEEGFSLVVFPEGSRTLREGLRPFQRGAARIALECGVPVVPVHIVANPGFLRTGDRWYHIPDHPAEFRVVFHEPIEIPPEIRDDPVPSRQVRRLTELFQRRIEEISGQHVAPTFTNPARA